MMALRKKLESDKTPCERLPEEMTDIANKIKYCSHSQGWNEPMSEALQEMIEVCQNRLEDMHAYREEYDLKLQQRRNALADKLIRRKRK